MAALLILLATFQVNKTRVILFPSSGAEGGGDGQERAIDGTSVPADLPGQ